MIVAIISQNGKWKTIALNNLVITRTLTMLNFVPILIYWKAIT